MPKLALLDGLSLAYRAFFALPADLATTAGQVTNAVYGFTSMLIRLLGDEAPDGIAVAWDVPGPTFRSEEYAEYKAQRESPPDLFRDQLPLIREVLEAMRIEQIGVPGVEADDVIATLADMAVNEGWDVVVVTGDRDAFQLVGEQVRVIYTRRGISDTVDATPEWLLERYGVTPAGYVEYAALRGDTSDNLPGVPGVGEKTAAKLLKNYGSLEGIYEHIDEQTPKLRENLAACRDQVLLNHRLMCLKRDVEVDVVIDDLVSEPWDPTVVHGVFDDLAFRSLWDRLNELEGLGEPSLGTHEVLDIEVTSVRRAADLAELMRAGAMHGVEAVHDEGVLAGLAVATGDDVASFVPVDQLEHLRVALEDPAVAKVTHDAKPLIRELLERGITLRGLGFDTALAAYVVNPAQRVSDLSELALRELGVEVDSVDATEDAGSKAQGAFDFETSGPDLEAAGRRAVAARRLVEPLREQVEARGGMDLYASIELPLVSVLAAMELRGIGVDREYLVDLREDLRHRLATLEKEIHEIAGEPFNINSTLQLREVLFERLGLPVLKKTQKGAPSTDASVLAKLDHPIVESLLTYRELEKLRSTYVDGFLPLIEDDGRIRGRFNQMAAATGRLSAEQPNLQNIPIRSEEGRAIRRAFVAAPGTEFLVADYSQIELRILAHMSGDAGLVEAFRNDEDIHTATAARVAGVSAVDVTPDMRRRAKVINFGLLYGMEAYGLAQRLEISRDEAQAHVDAYFTQFPEVKAFMQGIVTEAKRTGFTTTLLGRRRYLPELNSNNVRNRQMGERMALNAPIQGTAADIIKKAMVELEANLADTGGRMLVQIHDELVLEVPVDELDAVAALTRSTMEGIVELSVPLRVDMASGATLADCQH